MKESELEGHLGVAVTYGAVVTIGYSQRSMKHNRTLPGHRDKGRE